MEVFAREAKSPNWAVLVNTTHDTRLPSHGKEFVIAARCSPGLLVQQVNLEDFNLFFLSATLDRYAPSFLGTLRIV